MFWASWSMLCLCEGKGTAKSDSSSIPSCKSLSSHSVANLLPRCFTRADESLSVHKLNDIRHLTVSKHHRLPLTVEYISDKEGATELKLITRQHFVFGG
ncbi:hypothetical protein ASPBRDRAFT_38161 [Aspergillus brasiliensis CBS 101740]|uniref:Uncharacterized protein n=1 Tax=Aspergillus brasiliensis (strain CBS 101740 / IMI 381727 / IBT 21946) TaxID=767769 RepID=A0A1L9UW50_ASPBC|nr:hypothetical protein ASPBRDRAFT_38161 [Aspergillus brasiliensis CBS 101740]